MANFNKVILVGRLTRDPEIRATNSGIKVAAIGFAVTNRKKNPQSGQWEDDSMFIDVTAFDRANEGRGLATTVEQYCKKGSQIMIEGKLFLDTWEDKNGGGKRSKHKIIADLIQLLDSKGSGPGGMGESVGGGMDDEMDAPPRPNAPARTAVTRPPAGRPAPPPAKTTYNDDGPGDSGGGADDIPF